MLLFERNLNTLILAKLSCTQKLIIFEYSFRSTANAIQNYSFEAKTDDLPSLADKMSLLDIGSAGNNVTKIPIERSNGSAPMITKIPIERVDKGKYSTSKSLFQTSRLCGCVRHTSVFHRVSRLYRRDATVRINFE